MNKSNEIIDGGNIFNFGRTSEDYARYRDIYPQEFYEKILKREIGLKGQKILDLGTGTGVLPRNMYTYGAKWTGLDIAKEQIKQAKLLSEGMDIDYYATPVEDMDFPNGYFDVITACQSFFYFNHENIIDKLDSILVPQGRILVLYMAWLPYEDKVAGESEKLVLKYNPDWSGAGEVIHPIFIPDCYNLKFDLVYSEEYTLNVHFTRESWNGRMKSCRGIGASLNSEQIKKWEQEHINMLKEIAPNEFDVKHYAAIVELRKKV